MNLIHKNIIEQSTNTKIIGTNFEFLNKVPINTTIWYPFLYKLPNICENGNSSNNNFFIYYREDLKNNNFPDNEIIKRFIINIINPNNNNNNICNIIPDDNFQLNLGVANHNFRLFNIKPSNPSKPKDENNYEKENTTPDIKIIAIGGQAQGIISYIDNIKSINDKYKEYNSDKNKLNLLHSNNYNIFIEGYDKIINPKQICSYYGNGLHLFNINFSNNISNNISSNISKNDIIYEVGNNGFPIISGIHPGRYDGHYGNKNINQPNNGLSVFDSNTNLIFNEKDKKYYLYQRANLGTGIRYIQYCSSFDLINWSPFNLINLYPNYNLSKTNIYYANIFKLNNINQYIALIPYNEKINNSYNGLSNTETINLYYSDDCINWHFVDVINTHKYYELWMISGEPILINNNYYFYMTNIIQKTIEIYTIEKDRFSYITNDNPNSISTIKFKFTMNYTNTNNNLNFNLDDNKNDNNNMIKINYKTGINGYLKFQIKNKNNEVIPGFTFAEFDEINELNDEYEKILSWNNKSIITQEKDLISEIYYLETEGYNFKLYAISGNIINITNLPE